VSTRDKIAFVSAVGNIFATALLLGMAPDRLPIWYTGQMIYYMPLRYFSYHRRGYHYFIADLCYWVNLLVPTPECLNSLTRKLVLFLWFFPSSSFLFIATYCLANGPVAWAIIAWRNSLVFHSLYPLPTRLVQRSNIQRQSSLPLHPYYAPRCPTHTRPPPTPRILTRTIPRSQRYLLPGRLAWILDLNSCPYCLAGLVLFLHHGAKKRENRRRKTH
jgi:hypothetical protein